MAKRKQVQRPTRQADGGGDRPAGEEKKRGTSGKMMPYLAIGGGAVAAVWALASLTNQGVVGAAYVFAYLEFFAGVVVLVSLSITVMVGLVATDRLILTPRHRVLVQGVHRTTGIIAVSFLVLHIALKVVEAHASFIDALIPFQNPNTLYVGMGTLASYCLVTAFWTGIARAKFAGKGKPWMWRALHSIGYLAWPIALGHGLLAGRAAATWVVVSYILCVVGVVIALFVRLVTAYGKRISQPKAVPSTAKAAGKAQSGPLEAATGARAGASRPMYRGAVRNQPSAEESLSAPRGVAWGGFSDEPAQQRRGRQTSLPQNAMEETQLMSKIPRDVVEAAEQLVEAAARRPQATAALDEDIIETTRPVRRAPAAREPEPIDDYEEEAPRRTVRRPLVPDLVEEEEAPRRTVRRPLVPELVEEETAPIVRRRPEPPVEETAPAARRPRRPEPPVEDDYDEAPAPPRRARRVPEPVLELDEDEVEVEDVIPAPRRTRRPAAEAPAKPAPRRSRRTEDEDEFGEAEISAAATPPRRTRRVAEEPEETAAPRRARRAAEDDDDAYVTGEFETVARRGRRVAEEEDEVAVATTPRRARRAADVEEEDEVAIATSRRARRAVVEEEAEEEDARPRRSHRAAAEDVEPEVAEVPAPRRARRAAPAEVVAEDDDERAAVDEYWRPPANPVSRYEEEEIRPARPDFNGDDTPTLVDLSVRRAARSARPAKDAKTRRPGRAVADEVSDDEFWARMRGEAK